MLVVWDVNSGTPRKTIFNPHPEGVLALDINSDGTLIATLSKANSPTEQEVTLWKKQSLSKQKWMKKLTVCKSSLSLIITKINLRPLVKPVFYFGFGRTMKEDLSCILQKSHQKRL